MPAVELFRMCGHPVVAMKAAAVWIADEVEAPVSYDDDLRRDLGDGRGEGAGTREAGPLDGRGVAA
jgi:hypothetical protein